MSQRPPDAALIEAVRTTLGTGTLTFAEILRGVVDMESWLERGRAHGVDLLIAPSVLAPKAVRRSEVGARIHRELIAGATRSLGQVAELQRVLAVLRAAAVPATPFKGVTLSVVAYGDSALRRSSDIDVYVPRSHMPQAIYAMRSAGYDAPGLVPGRLPDQLHLHKECQFLAPDRSMVELQWAAAPWRESVRLDFAAFRTMPVQLGDVEVSTFAVEELLVYLCLHGCRSAWSRLLWIADIAALLLRFGAQEGDGGEGIDWRRVCATAQRGGVMRMLHIGLGLARRVLGAPLPSLVSIQVQRDHLAWAAVDRWLERVGADTLVATSPSILPLGTRDRGLEWARSVIDTVLTPTEDDWAFAVALLGGSRWLPWVVRPIRLARDRFG